MAKHLNEYELQLQQVEAALLVEPDKEELLLLKKDLLEIISLTKDLSPNVDRPSTSHSSATKTWKEGDQCMAKPNLSTAYYACTITSINDDVATVTFVPSVLKKFGWKASTPLEQQVLLNELRKLEYTEFLQAKLKSKAKKKKQKKKEYLKELDDYRETEKNKWLEFKSKTNSKIGTHTKSIFASPESVEGRVGIGTCGISGRPMTEFVPYEKHVQKKPKK